MKQSATVTSNDPQQPAARITLNGLIKEHISIKPSTRIMLRGYHGEKAEQQVTIAATVDEPLTLTDLSSTIDDKIEYSMTTVKKDKEYLLTVKTRTGIEEPFRGKISLTTNSKKKPRIDLVVMGSMENPIRVSPQYLYFGIIDTAKESDDPMRLQRTAMMNQISDHVFTIKDIKTGREWISATADSKGKGTDYTITIKLDKNKLPKGKFRETITIVTESENKSDTAAIIVEGKVI
jgi:hypothetical protein